MQFNTNGRTYINKGWLKSVNWLVSGSYNNKVTHEEDMASNALSIYSVAMQDGLIYTDKRDGKNVFDKDGNQITNITEQTKDVCGRILPYSYFYQYDIYGKEINAFAKVNMELGKSWDKVSEKILVGADFKTDGNLGDGSVYQDETPPFRSVSNTDSGYRRRPYYDIPFVNQFGAYVQNDFNWRFASGREFNLSAGVRFDGVNHRSQSGGASRFMTLFAPRVNASLDVFPWMMLRGGWGITGKAPTSLYLYPNFAYHDIVLYNGMDESRPENERFLLARTDVYDVTNMDLDIARNRKAEIGVDFHIAKRYRISLTAFDEYMGNGYSFGQDLNAYKYYQTCLYSMTPAGLEKSGNYNLFFETYRPLNRVVSDNRGLEYEIDLGRFDPIRTSFYITGAWIRSSSTSNQESFSNRTKSGQMEHHVGIYNAGVSTSFYERLNTTMRIIHNIPKIGLVISLTTQFEWFSKDWTEYKNDDMFVKYISYHDGLVHDFDPAWKTDPEFSYMFPTLSDARFIAEKRDPYVTFNLNLSKEIGDWLTASFYVNNVFNSRPLYRSKVSGQMSELGLPMYFGFEFKVTIK